MIRELCTAAALTAAALCSAPLAAADDNFYPDQPGRYANDVPGMVYGANLNAPCYSWERNVFGRGRGGATMACRYIPNQFPPIYTGFWITSPPLRGVQERGAPCDDPETAAQSPDGLPMVCLGERGWTPGVYTGSGFFPT